MPSKGSTVAVPHHEIADAFRANTACVFIGSGTSCACGLPSWDSLVQDMKSALRQRYPSSERRDLERFLKSNDATKIAGAFKRRVGKSAYIAFLRERLRHRDCRIAPVLRRAVQLPAQSIFTTNFDKLIETAARKPSGEDPLVVIHPSQLSGLNGHERRVIKLHGDIDHPDSIVFTDEDYAGYDQKYESLKFYFQGHLAFSTMLLIGFGLRDPNFDRIYAATQRLVPAGTRVVALMSAQNRFEASRWEAQGLLVNNLADHDEVPAFLNRVLRLV